MATTRIYVVTEDGNTTPRLVRANYLGTAIRHAVAQRFHARAATHADLEKFITAGVRVEHASEDTKADAEAPEPLPLP